MDVNACVNRIESDMWISDRLEFFISKSTTIFSSAFQVNVVEAHATAERNNLNILLAVECAKETHEEFRTCKVFKTTRSFMLCWVGGCVNDNFVPSSEFCLHIKFPLMISQNRFRVCFSGVVNVKWLECKHEKMLLPRRHEMEYYLEKIVR